MIKSKMKLLNTLNIKNNVHTIRWHNNLNLVYSYILIFLFIINSNHKFVNARGCSIIWQDGKETAKCDGQDLINVPSGLSTDIHVIKLENNNLQTLPSKIFQERGLINLQKIFLSNCKLGEIKEDSFYQLNHLVELDLSVNFLTSVPSESFKNLKNVKRLLLRQNPIKTLKEFSFSSLEKLEHLDLSHCQIDFIEPASFRGIKNLKSLKLNDNMLTTINQNVVVDIPNLYSIGLENNPWNCDCDLRPLYKCINDKSIVFNEPPQCKTPLKLENKYWNQMSIDKLACNPVMLVTENEYSGQINSNATFVCRIKSLPKPEIDWRVEEPSNLIMPPSNNQQSNQIQTSPPYTLNSLATSSSYNQNSMNSEVRYLTSESISETEDIVVSTFTLINIQFEDAHRKFICIAKNNAGSTQENFTVNVFSASTNPLNTSSMSYKVLILFSIIFVIVVFVIFALAYQRKQADIKSGNNSNTGNSESKLSVLKSVKNSLAGNFQIGKNTSSNTNHVENNNKLMNKVDYKNQDLSSSQKAKLSDTNTNNGLYVNGYANKNVSNGLDLMNSSTSKFMNSNLQFNNSALSPYSTNLNSSGLTLLNNEIPISGDLMNNSNAILGYDRMANAIPQEFTLSNQLNSTNNLASSQYGTSFVQFPANQLVAGSNYIDSNNGYLGSNEQLLNGFNNYENMYSSFNQSQPYVMQNNYGTYTTHGSSELQMQSNPSAISINPGVIDESVYYQNTLGKRNSPLMNNNLNQNSLSNSNTLMASQEMSIYATLQQHNPLQQQQLLSQQALNQHHVNILGQGSYNIAAQPTVVRYSPDEGYAEETANSNFTLEGTEV